MYLLVRVVLEGNGRRRARWTTSRRVHVSSVFVFFVPHFGSLIVLYSFECSGLCRWIFIVVRLPGGQKKISSSYKFNHSLKLWTKLAVQYIRSWTKGQFKEDNPLKQSADHTCGTVFIPLWSVWKGSLELWIEHAAGQRPLNYHRPDRQRGVSSHSDTLLSTEFSLLCSNNTFMQVEMRQRPLCLLTLCAAAGDSPSGESAGWCKAPRPVLRLR